MLVQVPQGLLELLGVDDHGAEFVHAEQAAAVTGALLHEHHRPRAGEFDGQRQPQQHRRNQHQDQQCAEAGQDAVGARQGPRPATFATGYPATTLHVDRGIHALALLGVQAFVPAHIAKWHAFFVFRHKFSAEFSRVRHGRRSQ
ncbi:hypothetical protein D3C81_1701740 [compost metagenome]